MATALAAILFAGAACPAAGLAQEARIGQVKTVSGEAVLVRGGQRFAAKPGDPVYQHDVIETGAEGAIGITFRDDSVFAAGPDSQLSLADFRFDRDAAGGNAMLTELRKGTLMIVSGEIPHSGAGAMKVKTPTTILGVRGTTFGVAVR